MSRVQYAARTYTIGAGETIEVARDSAFLTCLSSTGDFKLRFDDGTETLFEAGLTYTPLNGFQRISARNIDPVPIVVTFGFGKGEIKDSRVTIGANTTLSTRQRSPDTFTTGGSFNASNGATTALVPADLLRREVVIVAPDTAAGPVYIGGDLGAAAGEGLPVQPGQSLTLETGAGIYARNDTGAAVALAVASMGWAS